MLLLLLWYCYPMHTPVAVILIFLVSLVLFLVTLLRIRLWFKHLRPSTQREMTVFMARRFIVIIVSVSSVSCCAMLTRLCVFVCRTPCCFAELPRRSRKYAIEYVVHSVFDALTIVCHD